MIQEKIQVWIQSRDPEGAWRVLLLLTLPARGGFWQPVTGSVEVGESLGNAASREAIEETGLVFALPPVALDRVFEFDGRRGRCREHVFALRAPDGLPAVKLDPHEHHDYRWVKPDEADSLLGHESSRAALRALGLSSATAARPQG